MSPDKRKAAIEIILGHGKPKSEPSDDVDGLESALEELASALSAKDWKAAAVAFRSACELAECEPKDEPEGDEDEDA